MSLEHFRPGMAVRYVPYHAKGNQNAPDCEDGVVIGTSDKYVFVKYAGRGGAQATRPEYLVPRTGLPASAPDSREDLK